MTGKWPYKRVEEIALKVAMGPFGSSIKVETFTDTGIPIISGQHLREAELTDSEFNFIAEEHADSLKNANVQRGDVIFTHAGNIGQVAFIPNDSKYQRYVISQRQFYLRCDTSLILPEFITYYFKSSEGQHKLLANANQVGVPSIARPSSYLKTIEVPVPSIEEQQIVVRNIKALDAKIRANRRINQTLEAMAQAIFKSWFVDFDPVKAKITAIEQGQDPLRAAMRAISGKTDAELDQMPREHHDQLAATATLFPDAMEASELGEIPKGWSVSKIETLLSRLSAKTRYTKGQISEYGQIPVFEQGSSILLGYHNRDAYYQASSENPIFIFGDHTCVTRLSCQPFDISQNVIPLKGKNRATAWAYYAVKEKQKFQEYRRHWMELISKDVVVATVDICLDFSKKITNIHLQIEANERQKQSLRELRDTLLPKLLSGELSVADLEVPA